MAINYTNLFEDLGEYVERSVFFQTYYTEIDSALSEIQSELQGNGRYDILSGEFERFQGFKAGVRSWISEMVEKCRQRLVQRETILDELGLASATEIRTVLQELIRDMNDNSQTVEISTVTVGSVADDKVNASAGTVVVGKVLDGVSSPHPSLGFAACPEYIGLDSELADDETITLTVLTDSEGAGAVTEGTETFQIEGEPGRTTPFSWESYGSGVGGACQPIQAASLMTNLALEDFTSNVPDGWDLDNGSAGTQVLEETSDPYYGDSALKFTGNASAPTIKISQTIVAANFEPKKRYCVAFWVKGQGGTSAGTLTIQFEGTGYTAGSGEKIEMNAAALAAQTSYGLEYFFMNMPAEIPSDMELVIKWTGTPSAHSVKIDWGGCDAVKWHGGVHMNPVAGAEKFLKGDRFSFAVSNDDAGVFQTFFRKAFGIQLPSDASPSIDDALASD